MTEQEKDFMKVLGLVQDDKPSQEPTVAEAPQMKSAAKKKKPAKKIEESSAKTTITIPSWLYRKIRALSYYRTLSGNERTIGIADMVEIIVEDYVKRQSQETKDFISRYAD